MLHPHHTLPGQPLESVRLGADAGHSVTRCHVQRPGTQTQTQTLSPSRRWSSTTDPWPSGCSSEAERQGEDCGQGHTRLRLKAAVHWVRVNALSAELSPNLAWDAVGLRADSARRLSVRAEPLTR